jgi:anaerobic selenocysteine-containing dehydrogenase
MATTVRTMCPMNCHPTLCGMLVDVHEGKVVGVRGDPENPDSRGFLCIRGQASHEILGNPNRLLYPMMRASRADEWRRATWDEALDTIADRMRAVGREAVAMWTGHGLSANNYGTRLHSYLVRRFSNLHGSQSWNATMICWGLGGFGLGVTGVLDVNTPALPTYEPLPTSGFPLQFRQGRTLTHFHAFYDHGRALPSLAAADPEPLLWMSPRDATARGIDDRAPIRMWNERGEMRARAHVTERIPAGTVWMRDEWEGLNVLTSSAPVLPDAAVDIFGFSAGQSTFDASIDVAPVTENAG